MLSLAKTGCKEYKEMVGILLRILGISQRKRGSTSEL
jgi:hypothetical protein